MSFAAPNTPDNTPRKMALNRSFTLPAKVATTSRNAANAEIGATEGVETLYIHPNAKIVKFTSASPTRSTGTPRAQSPSNQGVLPWATLTEQTLAAGPLEIYRVPGSVSFIHSGSLLHAILPRSNCWCVDGVSKFAMRVRADTYYRIELPGASPDDLEKVEEFKQTLKKVLFYERTACPFARTFTVDLPEEPQIRRKKKRYHGPAKKWKLEKAYSWKPEDGGEPPRSDGEAPSGSVSASDEDGYSSGEEQSESELSEVADQVSDLKITTPSRPSVRERARGFNLRSVTAPAQLPLQSAPTSKLRASYVADEAALDGHIVSRTPENVPSMLDPTTLRPFQAIPTDMPPSPPDSSAGLDSAETSARPNATINSQGAPVELNVSQHAVNDIDSMVPRNDDLSNEGPFVADTNAATASESDRSLAMPQSYDVAEPWTAPVGGPSNDSKIDHDLQPLSANQRDSSPVQEIGNDLQLELVEDDTRVSLPNLQHAQIYDLQPEVHAAPADNDKPILTASDPQDPFAQIQARIQARRSIGGTTQFHLSNRGPTRQSSSSTASSGSSLASSRSSASRVPHQTHQQQQAFATALVRKACATFLGPPAHLVMIMLRIAARFAKGAFPSALLFESPVGVPKRVPGSFDLDGSDVEDFGLDDPDELDWEEDDFGVPLDSPVRLRNVRSVSGMMREHLKERETWSTDVE